MKQLTVWTLDGQRYALPLSAVDRVLRAVAVTPLPDAPEIISGIVNVHGEVIPVVDLRKRLRLPPRATALTDLLVLATSATRKIAFFADTVSGMVNCPETDIVDATGIVPDGGCVAGVVRMFDGMILIQDLDRFLSLDEARVLEQAMTANEAR